MNYYNPALSTLSPIARLPTALLEPLANLLLLFHLVDGLYYWLRGTTSLAGYARARLPELRYVVVAAALYVLAGGIDPAMIPRGWSMEAGYDVLVEAAKMVVLGWVVRGVFHTRFGRWAERRWWVWRSPGRTLAGAGGEKVENVEKDRREEVMGGLQGPDGEVRDKGEEVRRLRDERLRKLELAAARRNVRVRHVPRTEDLM
ncbi:hypothetical protein EDC01DRAFT_374948 [Geopyxis carbonaria]|nr:hypothetical protein EDC01DRAFT_374948 [Geopyxis carbonaria]